MSRATGRGEVIGWRERATLPGLCETPIKVKVDTGARTSALHAFDLKVDEHEGKRWADFEIHPLQRSAKNGTRVRVPIVGFRRVRSSSGHSERRPVIRIPVRIGEMEFATDITLTSRDEMGFRMLLGRSALRRRYLVDVARSYVQSTPPPKKVKK